MSSWQFGASSSAPDADAGVEGGDIVASNSLALVAGDWADASTVGVSTSGGPVAALGGITQAGKGLLLTAGPGSNVYGGAFLADALPAGDGVYVADFGAFAEHDGNNPAGVQALFAISPGGIAGADAEWAGARLTAQSSMASVGLTAYQDDNNPHTWPGWSGASISNTIRRYDVRIAIERVGTNITVYYVGDLGLCTRIDTYTKPATAGDIFFQLLTTNSSVMRAVRVIRVAVEGLAIVDRCLVSA